MWQRRWLSVPEGQVSQLHEKFFSGDDASGGTTELTSDRASVYRDDLYHRWRHRQTHHKNLISSSSRHSQCSTEDKAVALRHLINIGTIASANHRRHCAALVPEVPDHHFVTCANAGMAKR